MFVNGGVCLGAGVSALEQATGAELLCSTAQFLRPVRLGEEVTVALETPITPPRPAT